MDNLHKKREELMVIIMNHFSETFKGHAVLGGGMVLRLLDCPRFTNDLDYTFIPYKSKKEIENQIIDALSEILQVKLHHTMNSKCLRIKVVKDDVLIQVEVKVAKSCKTEILTTASLAKLYNHTPRVLSVMAYHIALANKMAAWLERRLIRDLYDIHFFLNLGIKPDGNVLENRLKKPVYSRMIKSFPGDAPISVKIFYSFMKEEVIKLTDAEIFESLSELLSGEERIGLAMRIKAAITTKLP